LEIGSSASAEERLQQARRRFDQIQKADTKLVQEGGNSLGLSTRKLVGGSTHPTVPINSKTWSFEPECDFSRQSRLSHSLSWRMPKPPIIASNPDVNGPYAAFRLGSIVFVAF
jgi:hypothetical protein